MRHHASGMLSNREICKLACKAYQDGLKDSNVIASFRKTGIQPFTGIEAIPNEVLTPSTPFSEEIIPAAAGRDTPAATQ